MTTDLHVHTILCTTIARDLLTVAEGTNPAQVKRLFTKRMRSWLAHLEGDEAPKPEAPKPEAPKPEAPKPEASKPRRKARKKKSTRPSLAEVLKDDEVLAGLREKNFIAVHTIKQETGATDSQVRLLLGKGWLRRRGDGYPKEEYPKGVNVAGYALDAYLEHKDEIIEFVRNASTAHTMPKPRPVKNDGPTAETFNVPTGAPLTPKDKP